MERYLVSTESPDIEESGTPQGIPVLPLRDVVVYPHMVIPLFVGREKSILALDQAMRAGKGAVRISPVPGIRPGSSVKKFVSG